MFFSYSTVKLCLLVEVPLGVVIVIGPVLVAQFEFVEWTPDRHLRHSRFVGLREA